MTTLDRILTDREKDAISRFVNDSTTYTAVKKVVLSAIYFDGTIRKDGIPNPLTNFLLALGAQCTNGQITRKQLAEKVEASLAGVQLLEKGFEKLNRFSKIKKPVEKSEPNPGR